MVEKRDQTNEESPVIVLSKKRTPQLKAKLEEYKGRLDPHKHPDLQLLTHSEAMYKITVLERLLIDGSVQTHVLSSEMAEKLGNNFDVELFDKACAVIEDYCKTGGKNLIGGSGLPKANRFRPSSESST